MRQCTHNRGTRSGEKGAEKVFREIMAEDVPTLMKSSNLHVQEASGSPIKKNKRRSILRKIIVKNANRQNKNIKSKKRKMIPDVQGKPNKIIS